MKQHGNEGKYLGALMFLSSLHDPMRATIFLYLAWLSEAANVLVVAIVRSDGGAASAAEKELAPWRDVRHSG